ncbi:MerR family transcriptional regulator [Streptomyces triticagri]|uniref:MerR family transcriptional regulator n=1 Tax=Streptomyces triticagri TaxID=2293568 RepID=A0A372M4V2_9ACTN|nr:MerR family transcriptional regulator [Streptomyces triticagri]RFU85968.1 MerR family transcriptional regulator [Streptomyces triticagri]
MLIGELAERTGVSTRALRHYEDRGLLVPARNSSGYRVYAESDIARVAQIRAMIAAGLGTALIVRYLDCARGGAHGVHLDMCPSLRAELDAVSAHLTAQAARLRETRARLAHLSAA